MIELWRVQDRNASSVAHLVRERTGTVGVVTACGWLPTVAGVLITRPEMVAQQRYACTSCLRSAKLADARRMAVAA